MAGYISVFAIGGAAGSWLTYWSICRRQAARAKKL